MLKKIIAWFVRNTSPLPGAVIASTTIVHPPRTYNHLDDILAVDEEWIIEHVNGELAVGDGEGAVSIDDERVMIFTSQCDAQTWYDEHIKGLAGDFNWRVGRR